MCVSSRLRISQQTRKATRFTSRGKTFVIRIHSEPSFWQASLSFLTTLLPHKETHNWKHHVARSPVWRKNYKLDLFNISIVSPKQIWDYMVIRWRCMHFKKDLYWTWNSIISMLLFLPYSDVAEIITVLCFYAILNSVSLKAFHIKGSASKWHIITAGAAL